MIPLDEPGELIQIGQTSEFAFLRLDLLGKAGWDVAITKPFAGLQPPSPDENLTPDVELAGAEILVIVERDGLRYAAAGSDIASVAATVFAQASRHGLRGHGLAA